MDKLLQGEMKYFQINERIKHEMMGFSGSYAVYANDLKGHEIMMDSHTTWETASCIKVPILVALFDYLEKHQIDINEKISYQACDFVTGSGVLRSLSVGTELSILDVATLMIIVSDNIATNMIIEMVGLSHINAYLQKIGLKEIHLHHKLDFEKYSDLGSFTAQAYGQLFKDIFDYKLFNKEKSDIIIDILSKQHYSTIMTRYLPSYLLDSENTGDQELVQVFSKSGSLDQCRNDGGVIRTPFGDFIVIVLTKDFSDTLYHSDHEAYTYAPKITALLYNHFISNKGRF